jgi:regulator of sigma E protease
MHITFLGVLFFLLLVTVLVAAHELGHFMFARLFKMEVEEFAIGLGKPKWVWRRGTRRIAVSEGDSGPSTEKVEFETDASGTSSRFRFETTEYTVRPLPLGGFVRIKGMEPKEDGSEIQVSGGFYSKPPWQRFLVLFAGPVFSILAGVFLLAALYAQTGVARPPKDPIIAALVKDGPADKAGLKPGDRIAAIQGTPVATHYDMVRLVRVRPGQPTEITLVRDGKTLVVTATPRPEKAPMLGPDFLETGEEKVQGKLGIQAKNSMVKVSPAEAFVEAAGAPVMILSRLAETFKKPSRLKDEVGGPISILRIAQESADVGLSAMVGMAGILSISLGIFNLLPASPLDGGQMVVAFVEALRRGRRLSFKVQGWILSAGLTVVALMVISVFALDISRLGR